MRISDWSSDVCSSDLPPADGQDALPERVREPEDGGLREPYLRPRAGPRRRRSDHRARRVLLPRDARPCAGPGAWRGAPHADHRRRRRRRAGGGVEASLDRRSEEHTSELQSLMRISYAVFCLKTKTSNINNNNGILKVNKIRR